MKALILGAMMIGLPFEALAAGHGTIRETDTEVVVEYSDNAPRLLEPEQEPAHPAPQATHPAETQTKQEESLLDQRRREKYEKRAAEWAVHKQKMGWQVDWGSVPTEGPAKK